MMNIIDALRDDKEYYSGIGRNYLSNSDIGTLINNPQAFGMSRPDSKTLAEGRYFHQLLIEPDKAVNINHVDVSTRNTKEYKNYCEINNLEFAMLTKEKEDIDRLARIMRSNIQFYDDIYAEGNQYEVPAVGEIDGLNWKGKADIVGENIIIDLKTTSDINKFRYNARAYNYDSQCYIYQMLFGKPLVFYVIDKVTGQLGIYQPSENFISSGRSKVARAVDVYKKYFSEERTEDIQNHYILEVLD